MVGRGQLQGCGGLWFTPPQTLPRPGVQVFPIVCYVVPLPNRWVLVVVGLVSMVHEPTGALNSQIHTLRVALVDDALQSKMYHCHGGHACAGAQIKTKELGITVLMPHLEGLKQAGLLDPHGSALLVSQFAIGWDRWHVEEHVAIAGERTGTYSSFVSLVCNDGE